MTVTTLRKLLEEVLPYVGAEPRNMAQRDRVEALRGRINAELAKTPRTHRCSECDQPDGGYVVHDSLWAAHGNGRAVLCQGCFEIRLGRPLTVDDLKDVPLNRLAISLVRRCHERQP